MPHLSVVRTAHNHTNTSDYAKNKQRALPDFRIILERKSTSLSASLVFGGSILPIAPKKKPISLHCYVAYAIHFQPSWAKLSTVDASTYLQNHIYTSKMSGKFEPKTPVNLNPPKDDPISLEDLAKADGECSCRTAQSVNESLYSKMEGGLPYNTKFL